MPDTLAEGEVAAAGWLRPSEYTAALINVLRGRAAWVRGADVLETGSGSGVVLAALGALGAASLCGIDIEHDAVVSGELLLRQLGHGGNSRLHRGDLWAPVAGRRFDLVAANLPHFPMPPAGFPGRLPSWSCGGPDGRALLDPFLQGLPAHLTPGGRAVITHNGFVDLDRSRAAVERGGLELRVADTVLIYLTPDKLGLMTPEVLDREDGRAIHRYGPYTFAELHLIEIGGLGAFG